MTKQTSSVGQWAHQQKEGLQRQEKKVVENKASRVAEGGEADRAAQRKEEEVDEGDNRTPEKTIGQVKYADGGHDPKQGGAGEPQTSPLEPEKQGGIGGP